MYQNKTIKEVYDIILGGIQQQLNTSLRLLPKSFIRILAMVLAGVFIIPYKIIGWFFLQIFVSTAYYGNVRVLGHTVNPLGTVGKQAIVAAVTAEAIDAEIESTYRARVVGRFSSQPQGGALTDYRSWASEVAGVYQTYIYTDTDSPAGVLIYVSADPSVYPSRIPPSSVLIEVGETASTTRRPARGYRFG